MIDRESNPAYYFLLYDLLKLIWLAIIIEGIRMGWLDFLILVFLQWLNGFIGWREASNAIAVLKSHMATKASVKRGGQYKVINSKLLVVGYRLHLKIGDVIPADAVIGNGFTKID